MRHAVKTMRIGVAGERERSGAGSPCRSRGLATRFAAFSRSAAEYPVDLTTGAGLDAALKGCEIVIDASNGLRRVKRRVVLVVGSRRVVCWWPSGRPAFVTTCVVIWNEGRSDGVQPGEG